MVVIGGIIGSGIFINPYIVAQRLDSSALVLGAWIAGGAIALAGALSYAELGSVFPRVGGQYAYLRDAYHPLAGFLYGWALLAVIETGAIAAVAITFATYALRLVRQAQAPPALPPRSGGPPASAGRAARHRRVDRALRDQLSGGQTRQPGAERARGPEG